MNDKNQTKNSASQQPQANPPADSAGRDQATEPFDAAAQVEGAEMTSQIRALEEELGQMKDRALRVQAELENYRKRVAREMADQRRYANLPLLQEILPVLDNMERAIEAAQKSGEAPGLLEGFQMVVQQLASALERQHCTPIKALHEPFDPNLHEAISQQPTGEHPPNTVVHVVQTGYLLHDRVVRPSRVIVSTPNRTEQDNRS